MDSLSELVKKYQIIHQTGKNNIEVIQETALVVLQDSQFKNRYKAYDYLNLLNIRASAGAADLIISRAGSTIFEIASWGKPAIIIPIPEPTSHNQRKNAYSYARSGGAEVIEEKNLSAGILMGEVNRIMESPELLQKMHEGAQSFARRDAARVIAEEVMGIALSHE